VRELGKSAKNGWLQAYTYFSFVYIVLVLTISYVSTAIIKGSQLVNHKLTFKLYYKFKYKCDFFIPKLFLVTVTDYTKPSTLGLVIKLYSGILIAQNYPPSLV
jgi:hypothetical protein